MALGITLVLSHFPLDYLEAWTCDLRVQLSTPTPPSGFVELIAIDPLTIENLKRDPDASDHAKVLSQLAAAQPYAVVYVNSPSRLEGSHEDFDAFVANTQKIPRFLITADLVPIKGEENELKLKPPLESLKVLPGPRTSDTNSFARDDVTRRLIYSYHGLPTLHTQLAQHYMGQNTQVQRSANRPLHLFEFFDTQQAYIDFRPTGTYQPTSFLKVLQGDFSPEKFKDKIVFIGYDTLSSSPDYIRTPYSRSVVAMSVLEMHANIEDTIIQNSAPYKASPWLNIVLTSIISILTIYVVMTLRPIRGLLILGSTFLIFIATCYLTFEFFNYWLGMAHSVLAIFICYYFLIPYRLIVENRISWEYFQRNKLLTQVEELKSNFLRMMSHDLKTPLARIQGMTEVVMTDPNPLSSKQKEALCRISQSSRELTDFISSILSLGRIESKEIKLQLKSKDVNELLKEVIDQCEYLATTKSIKIIAEYEPLFSIKIDEDLIRQVFTNLIENAIKYSTENSKILVSTEEIKGDLVIQVADQGIGIAPEDLAQIFTKFYRANRVKNSSVKGSGLGLYLASYFVELHCGSISADSELGNGSTFTVKLPMVLS